MRRSLVSTIDSCGERSLHLGPLLFTCVQASSCCRIWGANGQAALESASVCLINGTCLGTEILKNLVLPGIGAVTVVDGSIVAASDLGNNFFVTQDDIGRPRAQVTAELLQELNTDVDASKFVNEDPAGLIARTPEFFDEFTAVVVTQLADAPLLELGRR